MLTRREYFATELILQVELFTTTGPTPGHVYDVHVRFVCVLVVSLATHPEFGKEGIDLRLYLGQPQCYIQAVDVKTSLVTASVTFLPPE